MMRNASIVILASLVVLNAGELRKAPKFSLVSADNETVTLDSVLTRGPVCLSFWCSCCKRCVQQLDALRPYYDTAYKTKGLQILAISVDGLKSVARVKPFARSHKWGYTVLLDTDQKVKELYQVQIMPTAFIINQQGEIASTHVGFKLGDEKSIVRDLDRLFESRGEGD